MIYTCKKCGWQVGKYKETIFTCEKCGALMPKCQPYDYEEGDSGR